ncbi:MAG: ribosome-associated translation inhibitor RaiA [Firmicutes bacterium]|nr:ribosome-associated translation inhibitor RaiA [Bacillota bacterium]
MRINVRGKNIEITPALQEYVEKKLGKLEKLLTPGVEIQATLSVVKDDHIVDVIVSLGGLLLKGEEATQDMYASIDLVVDKLERQMHKYKTRINRKLRQQGLKELSEKYASKAPHEEEEPRVVKMKRFVMKPMSVEEAILQLNLLGHDFFVFTNADTDEINVLYKRKDGNYGLIEPVG